LPPLLCLPCFASLALPSFRCLLHICVYARVCVQELRKSTRVCMQALGMSRRARVCVTQATERLGCLVTLRLALPICMTCIGRNQDGAHHAGGLQSRRLSGTTCARVIEGKAKARHSLARFLPFPCQAAPSRALALPRLSGQAACAWIG
jgi:hypothetical protein